MSDYTPAPKGGGAAITSLICGIIGLVTSFVAMCCYGIIPIPLCIAGIITGFIGLKSDKRGMAIGGLICSIIGLLITLVQVVIIILAIAAGEAQPAGPQF